MGSVQVALVGSSRTAVQARLEEIAKAVGADVSPYNVRAGFETNGSRELHNVTSSLTAQSLSDEELAALLLPFQDEGVDTNVGVRFIVSPENIKDPQGW